MPTAHHWWDAQSKQTQQTYRQSIQTTRRLYLDNFTVLLPLCDTSFQIRTDKCWCVFIITDKAKLVGEEAKGVGVMKDEGLKLRKIQCRLDIRLFVFFFIRQCE